MVSRICAFLVWALVAAGVAFWGLRLLSRPAGMPPQALPVSLEQAARGDVLRLFPVQETVAAPQPELVSRFRVIGVVSHPGAESHSEAVALISVDGRPPVAIRVGQRVLRSEDIVVQGVTRTGVTLGATGGPAAATLTLPPPPSPATGSLPPPERLVEPPMPPANDQGAMSQPAIPPQPTSAGPQQMLPGAPSPSN